MILVGQYDSPYVRRVAISLRELGFDYRHDRRSVFGDFDDMRKTNPLARIPSLILGGGEVLIDSAAILDWLDEEVGADRALLAPRGAARRRELQVIALACGAIDKAGAVAYERIIRPEAYRWPEWMARLRIQAEGAIAALADIDWAALRAARAVEPGADAPIQAEITTGCLLRYLKMTNADLLPDGRYPALDALHRRLEARPAFVATHLPDVVYPKG
ncbi:MAG: glutathione S-transferase family protein [Proteobacteria bacterium]|nr:glutathione S-transferase family protein [Pseudomonadota bacterium]